MCAAYVYRSGSEDKRLTKKKVVVHGKEEERRVKLDDQRGRFR